MTELIKSPTSNLGAWTDPENAYASNDTRALGGVPDSKHQYGDYHFDNDLPSGIAIIKVEIGLEFYVDENLQSVRIRISTDGGSTWSEWSQNFAVIGSEETIWIDATAYKPVWSRNDFLNDNWKVEIQYQQVSGGSCPFKDMWSAHLDWIPTKITYEIMRKKRMLMNVGL